MERVIKLTAVIVALFFATNSFATIYPIINASEAKTLSIDLNDWAAADVNVIIRDFNGEILHNDDFAKGAITKRKYDLANLPNGAYTLEIAGNNKKSISEVILGDKGVIVNSEATKIVYKPTFQVKDNAIVFNHLALGEQVTILVSDDRGTFFTKSYKGRNTIHASFDTSDLPKGSYVFSVSTDNQFESIEFRK
jgi:hypothetical protein